MKQILIILSFLSLMGLVPVSAVCPAGCRCDDENLHVNCVDASLDIVPITLNPSVRTLLLAKNKIKTLDHGTLSFYNELIHVDLSHNHLVRIQGGSFSSQTKLVQLHLNANKISHLSNRTFGGPQSLMSSLAVLNLQNNLLETIDGGVFMYTPNLEELDLSQNSLRELNSSALLGLGQLRILKMENNELTESPSFLSTRTIVPTQAGGSNQQGGGFGSGNTNNLPRNNLVSHLADLSLAYNPISKIGPDAFSAARELVNLDLRGCGISSIDINAFRGLTFLRKLILIDNNLLGVPTTSFAPLIQLETLKIGRNPFDKLPRYGFGGLKKLRNLEVAGAPELSFIEPEAFSTNLDIENVEISNCKKLATLPPKLFKGLSGLKNMNLKDNALQDVPEDLVSWQSLKSLRLEGNPFRCVCEIFWLRDLLLEDKFKNSSTFVLCAEPKELLDKKLTSLSSQDLNCYLQGPVQKTILGISIAITIIILIIIFVLLYKYHESIKNTCKRGFRRPSRRKRSSVISSCGKELDTATKTSFLSQSPYPFSDDDFQVRASLMSASPGPNNGVGYLHSHSHTLNPVTMNSLNYPYSSSNSFNSQSLHHSHHHPHHYKSTPNNYTTPTHYGNNEYDAPINSINYPHQYHHNNHTQIDHNLPIHFALHNQHNVNVKPIPITEL